MIPPSNSSSSTGYSGFEMNGSPPANQFRILIVDDQAPNRLILSRLLNMTGYLTFEATDGQEALDRIATRSVDLVVMDVEMPNMTGLEAIRKIRELSDPRIATLPVIAATGNPQAESRQELLDSGANAFLTKPFDTRDLLKTIASLLSPTPSPQTGIELSSKRAPESSPVKNIS